MRLDLKVYYRKIGRKLTQEYGLEVPNILNTKNVYDERFNKITGERSYIYGAPIMIIPQWRIYF